MAQLLEILFKKSFGSTCIVHHHRLDATRRVYLARVEVRSDPPTRTLERSTATRTHRVRSATFAQRLQISVSSSDVACTAQHAHAAARRGGRRRGRRGALRGAGGEARDDELRARTYADTHARTHVCCMCMCSPSELRGCAAFADARAAHRVLCLPSLLSRQPEEREAPRGQEERAGRGAAQQRPRPRQPAPAAGSTS